MKQKQQLGISSLLFGRDLEIGIVRHAYQRVRDNNDSQLNFSERSIFIEGDSGIGKSALVEAALKDYVEQDQGWYITGKFDQMRSHRPFSALMDALGDLCLEAIAREEAQPTTRKADEAQTTTKIDSSKRISTATNKDKEKSINKTRNNGDKVCNSQPSDEGRFDEAQQILCRHEETAIHILLTLVPNLSRILLRGDGNQTYMSDSRSRASSTVTGSDSRGVLTNIQSKLRALIIDLFQVIAQEKCIVLFIEDLQWGDIDTLNLILYLVNNLDNNTKLLFVGTFRSEPTLGLRDHFLWNQIKNENNKNKNKTKNDRENNPPSPKVLFLSSLSLEHVTSFVASTLQIKHESKVLPLSELVHERTNGNILFVNQYLQFLHSNGHIYYSLETFSWNWEDVATIQDSGPLLGGDVLAVIEAKIQKLPRNTIEALQLASCLGGQFELNVIEFVTQRWWKENRTAKTPVAGDNEGNDVTCILWPAVEGRMLEEVSVASFATPPQYKFTHDKIQSAAYEMLGEEQKQKCHLCVGNCLETLHQEPSGQLWMLMLAASNLYKAANSLTPQESRDRTATINYNAALELKANATFESAAAMSQNALDLIGDDSWSRNYELSLNVHNLRAEMEFCLGRIDKCEESVSKILERARDKRDKYDAYDLRIGSLMVKRQYDDALEASLVFLRQMRFCRFPTKVTNIHVVVEFLRVVNELKGLDDETLLNLPRTEDEDAVPFMKTLMKGVIVAYYRGRKEELVFMSMRVLRISLRYGCTSYTPTAFALCGLVHGKLGKLKEAYRFGCIGMELTRRFNAPEANLICGIAHYLFLDHLYNECADLSPFFNHLHRVGMSTINAPFASSAGGMELGAAWYCGTMPLDELIARGSECLEEQIEHSVWTFIPITRLIRQKAMNLAGQSQDPTLMEGDEIKNLSEFTRQNSKDPVTEANQWWYSLELATWFGDTTRGEEFAKRNLKTWKKDFPIYSTNWMVFFRGLMWCFLYDKKRKSRYKKNARRELKILRGWVKDGLKNRDCFLLFVEAEYIALVKRKKSSGDMVGAFDKAMQRMKDYGLPHVTALLAERAGRSLKRLYPEDDTMMPQYLQEAVEGYKKWGAWGKVKQLEREFDASSRVESGANEFTLPRK